MKDLLRSKYFRSSIVILVILATFAVFIWYLATHPKVIDTLKHLDPSILILLTVAYTLSMVANAIVLHYSLAYVNRSTPLADNFLLTGYSSIVNFFGPLQSGPGFRAAYLKQKYGVEFRKFIVATLIFYLFFGVINSALILIAACIEFPQTRLIILLCIILGLVLLVPSTKLLRRTKLGTNFLSNTRVRDRNFWLIGFGALLLVVATAFAYGIEILHVTSQVNLWNVIVYTAAADLALFVSLTPGAIGFRETFLVFSQQLHKFSTDTIAAANVIDRAFYVVFLLVLFAIILATGQRIRKMKK